MRGARRGCELSFSESPRSGHHSISLLNGDHPCEPPYIQNMDETRRTVSTKYRRAVASGVVIILERAVIDFKNLTTPLSQNLARDWVRPPEPIMRNS